MASCVQALSQRILPMSPAELSVTNPAADSLSDFSEGSRDDIREMFGPDVYQERFRIDRSKLEKLMQADAQAAEMFFRKIMDNTQTYISWPHRLKVGAKSKKDPHVRIAGQPEDVQRARMRVLDVLDAKTDRVNMKLDVSYTDHSHIIGKGGNTIKQVMESTSCHIHFPDSNRNSTTEKSNQVSIAGTLQGVEKARWNIRRLMPIIFNFELPVTGSLQPMPDTNCPYVQQVMKTYEVEVMFRQRFKLHSTLVLVKGCDWQHEQVILATKELISFMCGDIHADQVNVEMSLEISPQHHSIVQGRGHTNLKIIMQQTHTRILFPDAEDPNIPTLKKNNIRISGKIEQVYKARQHLIGSLPVIVMFELPNGFGSEDNEKRVNQLMSNLEVQIKMRQKPRHSSMSVLVKGIERDVANVYEACHKLLRLEGEPVKATIPEHYHLPALHTYKDNGGSRGFGPLGTASAQGTRQFSRSWGSHWDNQPTTPRAIPQQCVPLIPSMAQVPQIVVPPHSFPSHLFPSPDSAIHSASVSSLSSPSWSPRLQSADSPALSVDSQYSNIAQIINEEMSDRRAPGCERKTLEKVASHLSPSKQKKIQGYKAMHTKPISTELRVPTSIWSGNQLSFSTPEYALRNLHLNEDKNREEDEDDWAKLVSNTLAMSNYLDSLPRSTMETLQADSCKLPSDLSTLLVEHNLERYIELFTMHEIDLETFLTLNESDLAQIGIDKFGPRKKMATIIKEISERYPNKSSSSHGSSPPSDSSWK